MSAPLVVAIRRGFSSKCRGVSGLLYPTPPPPFHQKGPPKFLHKFNNRRYKSDFPNPSTVKFDTLAMAKKMESMMPANEAQIISDTIHKCLDNTVSKQDLEKEIITINSKISGQDSKISVHDAELKSNKDYFLKEIEKAIAECDLRHFKMNSEVRLYAETINGQHKCDLEETKLAVLKYVIGFVFSFIGAMMAFYRIYGGKF